jgi:biotin transport system substrate-specific component
MFKKLTVRDLTRISLFTALICISSYIKIDLPNVPITAQTLAVMLAGCILDTRQAALSVFTYLLLGSIGVPVFSGGSAGIGIIFGKYGGYLIGFLLGVIVISLLKGKKNSLIRLGLANIIGGIAVVDLFGSIWLSFITGMNVVQAFMLGALIFIPGDLIKAIVAATVANRVNKYLGSNSGKGVSL